MKHPNIIILIMDTVNAGHLSCYNYFRNTTPNIDSVAEDGVVFEQGISTSSWTLPTHASILTGVYSFKHGAHNLHQKLDETYTTLPEYLKKFEYKTAAFSNNPYLSRETGLHRGFETFEELWLEGGISHYMTKFRKLTLKSIGKLDKGATEINKKVIRWLNENYDSDKPFFIFVNYLEPHLPYHPPRPFREIYLNKELKNFSMKIINQDPVKYIGKKITISDKEFQYLQALYDAEITYLDFKMGELFHQFKKTDIIDDILIIILADHGENIGHNELMGHEFSLSERILRIPFIFRLPKIFPGTKVNVPVQLVDVFPTIINILGDTDEDLLSQMQGKSLLPQNWENLKDRFTVSELYRPNRNVVLKRYSHLNINDFIRDLKAVRHKNYKYIWASDGKNELYDLESDSHEEINLINEEKQKAKELDNMLTKFLGNIQTEKKDYEEVELSSRTQDRLRALGYID